MNQTANKFATTRDNNSPMPQIIPHQKINSILMADVMKIDLG